MAPTDRRCTVSTRETRILSVSGCVFGVFGVARLFNVVQSGVVPLRHRCECRSPAFIAHVHEIRTTDGVCVGLTAAAGLPLVETIVRSQVANIARQDVRSVRFNLGEALKVAVLGLKGIVYDVLRFPSVGVESS